MKDDLATHQAKVLAAHAKYARWLVARDEIDAQRVEVDTELQSAEAELRALARKPK